MSYLLDCGCGEVVELRRQRICETGYIGGELVRHCHERLLPVPEEVCCLDCCC